MWPHVWVFCVCVVLSFRGLQEYKLCICVHNKNYVVCVSGRVEGCARYTERPVVLLDSDLLWVLSL